MKFSKIGFITFLYSLVAMGSYAMAITMGQEIRQPFCYDNTGTPVNYDINNPPSPAPTITSCYITISWPGIANFNVPAWWPVSQIDATVQSQMDMFNNPSTNTQSQLNNIVN